MLGIPRTYQGDNWQTNLSATPSTSAPGTTVTASASIHTKGSYTQIVAATTYDWYGFWLQTINTGTSTAATSSGTSHTAGNSGAESTDANIGGTGDIAVTMEGGGVVTFVSVLAGSILPLRCTKVMGTNTTATAIVALF